MKIYIKYKIIFKFYFINLKNKLSSKKFKCHNITTKKPF